MNKKELSEIKKQFTPENCTITRIVGCFVDHEKNIKRMKRTPFLSMSEEEVFKYLDIFKHTLSGTIGKNLLNMEFPLEQEMPGGTQEFLLKLRNSHLDDDELINNFFEKVTANYIYGENYFINLIFATYDVPGKSSDGDEMFDASDEVYEYIICDICPVNLSKEGLAYNTTLNVVENRNRDWLVENPLNGFLFPAFNDRASDIHNVLYYTKKPEEIQTDFVENILGATVPLTAGNQKETFNTIVADTLGEECDYNVVKNIHETLNEMIEEKKDEPEPLVLTKNDVRTVFEKSGVPDDKMTSFDDNFTAVAGEKASLVASNITNTKTFSVTAPDIIIKVNSDRTDLIETRIINGRQCLVIAVDDHIEVNGVNVKTITTAEEI